MARELTIGRMLLAVATVAFGVQCLIFSKFVAGLEPLPTTVVPAMPWTWVNGGVLIALGAGLVADRTVRVAALLLSALILLWVVLLHGPLMIANLKNDADDAFHALAISAAAMILAATAGPRPPAGGGWDRFLAPACTVARLCFGLATVGHGIMHFVFFQFTADFVPAWIPFHAFWAAATGVAQISAGLAILSGILARLAATLAGLMYGSWALIVHIPRVMAHPDSRGEWTSLVIASALCASALVVAGAMAGPPKAPIQTSSD